MKRGAKKGSIPWNNGTAKGWINKRGYACIKVNGVEKKVHRIVMEKILERPLMRHEDVHHIDGNKLNNAHTNLKVMKHSEHTRVTNLRPYKKGYSLQLSDEERARRSSHMKAIQAIKKATE